MRKWDRIIERQIEREQQEKGLSDTDYSGLEYLECEESNHGAVPGILPLIYHLTKRNLLLQRE